MNGGHFAYPPPGAHAGQRQTYFHPQAQYSPHAHHHVNPQLHGAYLTPAYPYPPQMVHAYPYSPPHPQYMPHPNHTPYFHPQMPGPGIVQGPPQQGLYLNGNPNQNAPDLPPGLPIAHRYPPEGPGIGNIAGAAPGPTGARDTAPIENLEIHEYWRGRLAPLPGYRSRPILMPMKDMVGEEGEDDIYSKLTVKESLAEAEEVKVKAEVEDSDPLGEQVTPELLPPMSFFGSNFKRTPSTSPRTPTTKLKEKENKKENTTEKKNNFRFDKYADSFVPQYLKKIQRQIHTSFVPLPALPIFPPASYLQSFLIPRLIEPAIRSHALHALLSAPPLSFSSSSSTNPPLPGPAPKLPPLTLPTYNPHFTSLLCSELSTQSTTKSHIILYLKNVRVAPGPSGSSTSTSASSISGWETAEFILEVPGIRENYPQLDVGDLVHMREVLEIEKKGSLRAVEGRVVVVRKREGLIHISSPPLKKLIQTFVPLTPDRKTENGFIVFTPEDDIPLRFNISFMMNARPLCLMQSAVAAVAEIINTPVILDATANGVVDNIAQTEPLKPLKIPKSSKVAKSPKVSTNGSANDQNGKVILSPSKAGPKGSTKHPPNAVQTTPAPSTKQTPTNLARQWIFPEPADFMSAPSQKLRGGEIKEDQWRDAGLNDEQRMAVTSVALYQSPVPHLISGPPGTGKTRTVVEAILQIFRVQPDACMLVCAPSNPATDTLVLRLSNHLQQNEMLRLNDPNRTFAEVPVTIRRFCYIENNMFTLPPFPQLMQYRVVVCSCLDAGILFNAQATNVALMSMEEEVTAGLHPHKKPKYVVQPHWTHLLIDEAAQGSEPELLIPISVVIPKVYGESAVGKTFMPQLALCGDINQLGPIVTSDDARTGELDVSLLERLFERPLYANFHQSLQPNMAQRVKQNGHVHVETAGRLPPYTHLVKNYRSHPAILMPPSAIFYDDRLQPCAKNGTVFWSKLKNPDMPLLFLGDESVEESTDERASWFNPGQITSIVNVVKSLIADAELCTPPLKAGEIGVMAPWREQVWKLRERLRKEGLHSVDVGTVEDYQGRESRVVIISCVRSNERFLEEDAKKGLGLVLERKRMNVAITRAKELLVVIGNAKLLSEKDPYWKGFLQFALRHKLYDGPKLSLDMDGNYISRLESALIQSGKSADDLDDEEQGVVVAGAVAREILRE